MEDHGPSPDSHDPDGSGLGCLILVIAVLVLFGLVQLGELISGAGY